LSSRLLRVLHDESFRDDGTRILRAARYAARLGFSLEQHTERLARHDAPFLAAISPARLSHDLERILVEKRPEGAIRLLDALGALRAIEPSFSFSEVDAQAFRRLRTDGSETPGGAEYLAAWAAGHSRSMVQTLQLRFELRQDAISTLRDVSAAVQALRRLVAGSAEPVEVVATLAPLSAAAVRGAGAAEGGPALKLARRYEGEWRHVRPSLRGTDVMALGVPPGPSVGAVLAALQRKKLKGELRTEQDERRWVDVWLKESREQRDGH